MQGVVTMSLSVEYQLLDFTVSLETLSLLLSRTAKQQLPFPRADLTLHAVNAPRQLKQYTSIYNDAIFIFIYIYIRGVHIITKIFRYYIFYEVLWNVKWRKGIIKHDRTFNSDIKWIEKFLKICIKWMKEK